MDYNNMLDHTLDRFGMVTVMDATLYDPVTNEPLLLLDTLKVSSITAEGSEKELRGGIGGDLLLTYSYGRTANVEMTDALASMSSIEYLWGAQTTQEGGVSYHAKEKITAGVGDLTLTDTSINSASPAFAINHTTPANSGHVDIAAGVVTATAASGSGVNNNYAKADGDEITVFYMATGGAKSKAITLKATDFPPIVKIVGSTFLLKQTDGSQIPTEIVIHRFKLSSNFTFTLEAEGDASVFDFSGVALSDENDQLISLKTLEEDN